MENVLINPIINGNDNDQCRTCLSIGRKMVPSGELIDILRSVTSGCKCITPNINEQLLCWECHALLSKMKKFQGQVQRANEYLMLGQESFSLSTLTTVIIKINEPNQIYVFDQRSEKDRSVTKYQSNALSNSDLNKDQCDYESFEGTCNFESNQVSMHTDVNILNRTEHKVMDKPKKTNKWAKERAMLNKKPKFKVINRKTGIKKFFSTINISGKDIFSVKSEIVNDYLNTFKCEECGIGFQRRKILQLHISKCHGEIPASYVCDICYNNLPDKKQLSIHIDDHYYTYKCKICDYICFNKNQRWCHVEKHRVLQCLKCELLFGNRHDFFKHYKEWHEKFICDYCGVTFKMRYCIKDHIKKQHTPFECKPCSKSFARYNGLWLHNKTHHSGPATPAYCVECDKRYPDSYRYRWHLANSAKHRPRQKLRIPCPECDKVFTKNIYMKDHLNLVHLKNYKYRCEECNKNFVRNADLKKHRRRVHEGIMPPKNKICYTCGRGFTTNKILANHMRTHTGERPYACAHCEARFSQSGALTSHVRTVHTVA